MILDVTESFLPAIKNPVLRAYANKYIEIYRDFMSQVSGMGLEIEAQDTTAQVAERIAAVRKKGAVVRNGEKSVYTNRISPSCEACQIGITSSTFFVSLKCHRDCFYCFNPNQQEFEYYLEHTRDTITELDSLRKSNQTTCILFNRWSPPRRQQGPLKFR